MFDGRLPGFLFWVTSQIPQPPPLRGWVAAAGVGGSCEDGFLGDQNVVTFHHCDLLSPVLTETGTQKYLQIFCLLKSL